MEEGDLRRPTATVSAPIGWDEPLTEEDMAAIDAVVEAASNRKKRGHPPGEDGRNEASRRSFTRSFSLSYCQGSSSNGDKRSPPDREDFRIEALGRRLPRSLYAKDGTSYGYPCMTFEGQILYSRTHVEVEKSSSELVKKINALKRLTSQVPIGFDLEWRPTFRRGAPIRRVAVVQICFDTDYCYVMHIIHSGIPQSLKSILEDNSVIKLPILNVVGVAIFNDAIKLQKDYDVHVQACEDLSCLANEKLQYDPRSWSLSSLVELLVSKQLPKPKNIRLGNWEALFLSRRQLQYAATDAFASWHLYKVLKSLPDLETCTSDAA